MLSPTPTPVSRYGLNPPSSQLSQIFSGYSDSDEDNDASSVSAGGRPNNGEGERCDQALTYPQALTPSPKPSATLQRLVNSPNPRTNANLGQDPGNTKATNFKAKPHEVNEMSTSRYPYIARSASQAAPANRAFSKDKKRPLSPPPSIPSEKRRKKSGPFEDDSESDYDSDDPAFAKKPTLNMLKIRQLVEKNARHPGKAQVQAKGYVPPRPASTLKTGTNVTSKSQALQKNHTQGQKLGASRAGARKSGSPQSREDSVSNGETVPKRGLSKIVNDGAVFPREATKKVIPVDSIPRASGAQSKEVGVKGAPSATRDSKRASIIAETINKGRSVTPIAHSQDRPQKQTTRPTPTSLKDENRKAIPGAALPKRDMGAFGGPKTSPASASAARPHVSAQKNAEMPATVTPPVGDRRSLLDAVMPRKRLADGQARRKSGGNTRILTQN